MPFEERIAELGTGEFQSCNFFQTTYGITASAWPTLDGEITSWAAASGKKPFQHGALRSRWVFERFFRAEEFITPRQAAFRLGVQPESLSAITKFATKAWAVPSDVVGDPTARLNAKFVNGLWARFNALRAKSFQNHTETYRALHAEFRKVGVAVVDAVDPTSVLLEQDERRRDLSQGLDVVSLGPVGTRFDVWLNFGKPGSLEPDRVSLVTFAKAEPLLTPFVPDYRVEI